MAKQKTKPQAKRRSKPKQAAAASPSGELSEEHLDQVSGGTARKLIDCEGYAAMSGNVAGDAPAKKQPKMDGVVILSSSLPGGGS